MMAKYEIRSVGKVRDIETANGKFKIYDIELEGEGWAELMQKPETPIPTIGTELEGTIVDDPKWGKKFKKAQQSYGGGGKFDTEGMAWGNALTNATSLVAAIGDKTLEIAREQVLETARVFMDGRPGKQTVGLAPSRADEPPVEAREQQGIDVSDLPF